LKRSEAIVNDISNSPSGLQRPLAEQAEPGIDAPSGEVRPTGAVARESILRHYWRIFWTRRWIVLGIIVASVLVGIVTAMLSQRQYAATATLEIQREGARIIEGMEDVQPRLGANQEFYQTQYALLQSRSLAERVVRSLRLAENDAFLTNFRGDTDGTVSRLSREQRERRAVVILMTNLEIVPVRLSSVVNVRYVSPDPLTAANVANSIAENYIEASLERRFEASNYAREFLENRLNQMRQRLIEAGREKARQQTME
jgi:polysaccharide biosynthesis transport protein